MPAEGVAPVKTYHVQAKRWEHGWELHIEGVGVTQSRTLWDAETMARDLISRREGLPTDSFDVAVTPVIGGGLDEKSWATRKAVNEAAQAQRQAAASASELARQLREAGLTGRDIAKMLGLSPQRVSQLLRRNTYRTGT
jgi:DNA-binding CsgD family transcriptional regulator